MKGESDDRRFVLMLLAFWAPYGPRGTWLQFEHLKPRAPEHL
jgi:hypothetical protein